MLEYVIKSALCLIVLFSFYKLFMEGEYFHKIKRIYLISSLIISILLPFITITYYTEVAIGEVGQTAVLNQIQSSGPAPELPLWQELLPTIVFSIYIIGFLIFGIRFYRNLRILIKDARNNDQLEKLNYIYVLLGRKIDPYSFFNYIFLNKEDFRNDKISTAVIDHEKAHVDQKHSYDLLFVELLHVVFWFNPIFFFLKRSVKLNHEFLADDCVIRKNINPLEYSNILVQYSSGHHQNSFASPIGHSLIKKRIIMISKSFSWKRLLVRSFIFIPILGACIYLFNEKIVAKTVYVNSGYTSSIYSEIQEQDSKTISIKVENEKIWVNKKEVSLDQFSETIDQLTSSLSEDDLESLNIHMNTKNSDPAFMDKLDKEFSKTRLSKITGHSILPPPPPLPPAAGQVPPAPPAPPHPVNDKIFKEEMHQAEINRENMRADREAMRSKKDELRALERKYLNDKKLSQSEREKVMRKMERKQEEVERKHKAMERKHREMERSLGNTPAPPSPLIKKKYQVLTEDEKNENGFHVRTIVSKEESVAKYPKNGMYYLNDEEISYEEAMKLIKEDKIKQVDIRKKSEDIDVVKIYN